MERLLSRLTATSIDGFFGIRATLQDDHPGIRFTPREQAFPGSFRSLVAFFLQGQRQVVKINENMYT